MPISGTDLNMLDSRGQTPLHLARGRLMLLQEDLSYSNEQLRNEVSQVGSASMDVHK